MEWYACKRHRFIDIYKNFSWHVLKVLCTNSKSGSYGMKVFQITWVSTAVSQHRYPNSVQRKIVFLKSQDRTQKKVGTSISLVERTEAKILSCFQMIWSRLHVQKRKKVKKRIATFASIASNSKWTWFMKINRSIVTRKDMLWRYIHKDVDESADNYQWTRIRMGNNRFLLKDINIHVSDMHVHYIMLHCVYLLLSGNPNSPLLF